MLSGVAFSIFLYIHLYENLYLYHVVKWVIFEINTAAIIVMLLFHSSEVHQALSSLVR